MQKYAECPRAWYFRYVAGLPDKPSSAGQIKGTQGHKRIELYEKGALDVLSTLEKRGVEKGLIPTPGDDLLIEHPFEGERLPDGTIKVKRKVLHAQDVPLAGYIDLVNLRVETRVGLIDWKFKKSIEDYGIRKADIFNPNCSDGIQLIGYSRWAAENFPERKTIEAGHVTFQTQGVPEAIGVFDEIPLDNSKPLWEKISDRIIPGMKRGAVEENPFKVFGNEKACGKYGGCAYRNKCFDPMERFAATLSKVPVEGTGEKKMGILKLGVPPAQVKESTPGSSSAPLNQGTVATAAVTPVADVSAPPVPSQAPPTAARAESAGPAPVPSLVPTARKLIIVEGDTGPWKPPTAPPAVGIVPPDSPRNLAPPAPLNAVPTGAAEVSGGAFQPPAGDPPKAKRGRPSKEELARRAASLPGGSQSSTAIMGSGASSPPTSAVEVQASPVEASRPSVEGLHRLFRGCEPIGVLTKSLLPYTLALEKQLLEAFQIKMPIPDLRLCEDKVLGFGRWQVALAAGVELADLPPGDYVVDTRDARVLCVADALSELLIPSGQSFRGIL